MIIDPNVPANIVGISNINPIQFWPPDKPTFNQAKIKLVPAKKYYQGFDFNESFYNRLDVALDSDRLENWDAAVTYKLGYKVYDPTTQTRWVSVANNNLNHLPNPLAPAASSAYWDHDPLIGAPVDFDYAVTYNAGDRALAYFGLGTGQHVVQSLVGGNIGNNPTFGAPYWEDVTESRGTDCKLRIKVNGVVIGSLDFVNIRPGSKHQFVTWLWSDFPEVADTVTNLDIYDAPSDSVLALSDCLRVVTNDPRPAVTIKYSNSDDFAGINFEGVNPEFYIKLNATFYEESHPTDSEDYNLSSGIIVSLRKQMITKRLFNIIELLPEIMHKKIEQILMCDYLEVDGLAWKRQGGDNYQRSVSEVSLLSTAKVLLTQADSVLVNISKGDILSGAGVFSDEFSNPFA